MSTSQKKPRKTLNISLQSKKYSKPVNDLANKWESEGENLSTEVCKSILLVEELNNSITFTNLLNMYELVKKMVYMYYPADSKEGQVKVEELLSKIISIDAGSLTSEIQLLSQGAINNKLSNVNASSNNIYDNNTEEEAMDKDEAVEKPIVEEKIEKKVEEEKKIESPIKEIDNKKEEEETNTSIKQTPDKKEETDAPIKQNKDKKEEQFKIDYQAQSEQHQRVYEEETSVSESNKNIVEDEAFETMFDND